MDWRLRSVLPGSFGQEAPRQSASGTRREIRSSRETCSLCPRGGGGTESFRGKTLSAPDAASRRSLFRWNKASPDAKTPLQLPEECKCSLLRGPSGDWVVSQLPPESPVLSRCGILLC